MSQDRRGPGFVHFVSIVLTVTTLGFGTVAYLLWQERVELQQELTASRVAGQQLKTVLFQRDEEIEKMKRVFGPGYEEIGPGEPLNHNTVLGSTLTQIRESVGRGLPEETVAAALQELTGEIDALRLERDALLTDKQGLESTVLTLENRWGSRLEVETQARIDAGKRVASAIIANEETIQAKTTRNDELHKRALSLMGELQEIDQRFQAYKAETQKKHEKLLATINHQKQQINQREHPTFETPDGQIDWIDRSLGMVWINLGSADRLPTRMSFSVYPRDHNGVARDAADIKGTIEVTRIRGTNMAEARITDEDLKNPIVKRDVIHTPLWSPGQSETFAFAGLMDIDGDGRSDDQRLIARVKQSGSDVATWVDGEGKRHGGQIGPEVRFLVVGPIPEFGSSRESGQREADRRMIDHMTQLRQEAAEAGVTILSLTNFLSYVGIRPTASLRASGSVPASSRPANSASPYGRSSTGNTSQLFRSGRLRSAKP